MKKWIHEIVSYSPQEVKLFCVKDIFWQAFRRSLKGISTEQKLIKLDAYITTNGFSAQQNKRAIEVQVSNYINALKRGGQLSMDLEVQR